MASQIRTFTEVANDLQIYMLRQNQKIDLSSGQVISDLSLNATASVMADLYANLQSVITSQSILNANVMATSDLDNLVANFGITRKGATPAQGNIIFYTPVQPLSDFQIPAGTRVATNTTTNSPQIVFSTINAVSFVAAFEAIYYNPNTGNWEITATVQAETAGSAGNIGPYTIINVLNSNMPFNVTNNNAITGGTDQESNQDLATRTINSFLGNNVGTQDGYLGTALSQPNVTDALVQGPGDPLMTRDGGQGGKVDIWCLTTNLGSVQLNQNTSPTLGFTWNNQAQSLNGYIFNFPLLPVDVNSTLEVVGNILPNNSQSVVLYESRNPAPSGIPYINAGDFHYTFNAANDLNTAHSVNANDYIVWNPITLEQLRTYPNGTNTSNILQIAVTYSYDNTIQQLQNTINQPNNKIITADVLIKSALEVTVDVIASISLLPSYSATPNTSQNTVNSVITAITNYINNNKMGTTVQEADIIQIIMNVNGVSNVVVNSVTITINFNPVYDLAPETVTNTSALANQYLSTGNVSINVI